MKHLKWISVAILLAAVFVGFSWWRMYSHHGGSAPHRDGIDIPVFSQAAEVGRQVFEVHCQSCHGPSGIGTDQGPPLIHKIYEPSHHADYAFVRAVNQGVRQHHWPYGDMPAIPAVSESDVGNIIAFVRELQRANGIQ